VNDSISFLDLVTPHQELEEDLCGVLRTALSTAGFIGGPMVQRFEEEFAAYCQTKYCVGVNSGTDALRFALIAAGVGTGDVVVTVPHSFIATTEAISQSGASIAFVDIDEATYNMDPAKLSAYLHTACDWDAVGRRLTDRRTGGQVKAIIPVHIYGQMADMDPIRELAEAFGLIVIEDSCQAHGADYFSRRDGKWLRAGSVGLAAAFSFYPGKNLGACGEAGAITTNDEQLALKMRMLRDHGQAKKYYHDVEGYNGRLDSIQAGFLSVKLKHLPEWTRQRQEAASRYRTLFGEGVEDIVLPFESERSRAVYHLFVVRVADREALQKHLSDAKIGSGIHYPIPLHLQKAYQHLGYAEGSFPVTERIAKEIVSLPMFPGLREDEQVRVVESVVEFVACAKAA
jgi:dTDP-4-amino-4,6-dideoxygalactose transaminase